jgi:hypothetical protein
VTLFWVLYTPLLVIAAGFFGWSLYRYLRGRRTSNKEKTQEISSAAGYVTPEIVALRAQFIVAPKIARQEAIALLKQRGAAGFDASGEPDDRLPEDFTSLLELLSRTRATLPAQPR